MSLSPNPEAVAEPGVPAADVAGAVTPAPSMRRPHPFLTSAAVVFVGNAVSRGLGFLFPLLLARVVGRDEFALAYFFVNVGFSAGNLVLTGFPTALTRYVSADPSDRSRWTMSAVIGGIPLLAVSIAAGTMLALQSSASPGLMVVVMVGLTIDAYYFALLRGLGWFGTLMLYRIAANAGQLVALLIAAALGLASVEVAVSAYALLYLVPIVAIEWRRGPLRLIFRGRLKPAADHIKTLFKFSIPALVSGVAYATIQGLDVYFVRLLVPEQLADYSAARSLAMPMQMVSFAVTVILLPQVASAAIHERYRLLRSATLVTALASLALIAVYLPLAGPLTRVFPASYHRSAELLVLIAPAFALMGFYSVLSQWWMGTGRTLTPAICITFGAAFSVVCEVVLTPALGASGAALSMACGTGVAVAGLGGLTVLEARDGREERTEGPATAMDGEPSGFGAERPN